MRRLKHMSKLLLLLGSMFIVTAALAQERTITGKVTDGSTGEMLAGATIVLQGTTTGVTTDLDGNFSITAKDGDVLVVSFIGYLSGNITLSGQSTVDVSLILDMQSLEEVVVIGYGTVKKEDLTGSVAVVGEDDFNISSSGKPQDLIVGKVAGVVVTPGDGAPTSGSQIRIRGGSSLNANNDPLIVIDGLPVSNDDPGGVSNPLATINPNDIESMTILKDASATAIYGSRASNGVIIITTKKGARGNIKVGYSGNISLGTIAKKPELLSGDEFREVVNERVANHGLTSAASALLGTENTDWQEQVYENALSTDHNLSFSGAPAEIPFRASLGYTYSNGLLKYSGLNRGTVSVNANPTFLDDHLKVGVNFKLTQTKNRFSNTDAISAANEFDPSQPIENGNTRYGGYTAWILPSEADRLNGDPINIATHNPVARLEFRDNTSNVLRTLGNLTLDYKFQFLPELRANLNVGYDYLRSTGDDVTDTLASWSYREPQSNIRAYENELKSQLLDFYLNYVKDIESIQSVVDVTAGYSYQYFYRGTNNQNRPWEPDTTGEYVGADTITRKFENYIVSFFGRLNYTLLDRYLLTGTLRYDGTSRFSEKNRWGLFPSVAFAWKVNEESFLREVDAISEFKLRLGWGVTGQQDVGSGSFEDYYPYLPVYTASTEGAYYQRGNNFLQTLRPGPYNEDLKWEETTTQNIGFDIGLYNNRFTASLDVYKRLTEDLISRIPIPNGTNFTNTLRTNVGTMTNQGFEASLNTVIISKQNLRWSVGGNFTYNKNEITKLTNSFDSTFTGITVGGISGGVGSNVQKHMVGYPANTFFLFKQVYGTDGMPIEGLYIDKTGNGGEVSANENNKYYMYDPAPDYVIGINSSLKYGLFDFSFSGRANIGNYVYNNNNSNRALYQNLYNQSGYLSNIPKTISETEFQTAQYWSDIYLENASFFRMDNISLGYSLDKLFDDAISGRVAFTVQNAFVISKYSGLDPEVASGIDNSIYPRPRTYLFGFNLDF